MISTDQLIGHWRQLLPGRDDLGRELLGRYAEPHRVYHTGDHLAHLLTMIDELSDGSEDLQVIRLAAWFHDAIYDPTATPGANEEASAVLAEDRLRGAGTEPATIAEVARLVRATAAHTPDPGDHSAAVLSDADMAILAAPPAAYRRYADAVRAEYAHLDDATFAAGRSRFLEATLASPIFVTPAGQRLRPPAAGNLAAELAWLRR